MMGDGVNPLSAYDANGNILKMQQWGLTLNTSAQIDNLVYNYMPNSNKLQNVIDGATNDPGSKLGDFRQSSLYQQTTPTKTAGTIDYTYDVNGNLVRDYNKDMVDANGNGGITYNYLNLPANITVKKDAATNKGNIAYTYDATGNKLRKLTTESGAAVQVAGVNYSSDITTTTDYVGGLVFESKSYSNATVNAALGKSNILQFILHEEGHFRFMAADNTVTPAILASFKSDYFIKDHLGNVRMVLTEEQQRDIYPVASLEPSKLATEKNYYDINDDQISLSSAATGITSYSNDNGIGNNPPDATFSAPGSTKLYRLKSNEAKTGLGITLKVMAGDKIDVFGKSYYFQNTTGTSGNSTLPVLDLLTAFLNAPAVAATAVHGLITPAIINTPIGTSAINTMMGIQNTQSNASPAKPRAFINVIFFDEQFKAVETNSRISMVGDNSIIKDHNPDLQNIVAVKSGYVYIYCSNESPVNVFFDNMQVVQTRGPILEETHYYPFGLTMAGISSKAAGKLTNKNLFLNKELQSKEFSDGSGLELYDFGARNYDPQIGRWQTLDPFASKFPWQSPNCGIDNDPINKNDPTGKEASPIYNQQGAFLGTDNRGLQGQAIVMDNKNFQQNMSHEDAISKSLGQQGLNDSKAMPNLLSSYNNLPSRPDFDGNVTISEGVAWAKGHANLGLNTKTQIDEKATPNDNVYLDASKMDFGFLSNKSFINGVVKVSGINLFDLSSVDFASNAS